MKKINIKSKLFLLSIIFCYVPLQNISAKINSKTNSKENYLPTNWELLMTLKGDNPKKLNPPAPLKAVLNKNVEIKGFMMPLDFESRKVVEFLFMPFLPNCMHVPPPPANQMILVKLDKKKGIEASIYPLKVRGKLLLENNIELESSYKINATEVIELKDEKPAQFNRDM